MSYWLYNGIKLPAPPEYDENVYPDMVLCALPAVEGSYMLQLFGGNWNFAYNVSIYDDISFICPIVAQGASRLTYNIYASKNYWSEPTAMEGDFAIYATDTIVPVWSNFDIYNEDGSLYLAASDPVKLFDTKDWIIGQVIGMASKPIPRGGVDE